MILVEPELLLSISTVSKKDENPNPIQSGNRIVKESSCIYLEWQQCERKITYASSGRVSLFGTSLR